MEGVVEEVDSGTQARFFSENELIEFLRQRFAQRPQSEEHEEGTNEPNDNRR